MSNAKSPPKRKNFVKVESGDNATAAKKAKISKPTNKKAKKAAAAAGNDASPAGNKIKMFAGAAKVNKKAAAAAKLNNKPAVTKKDKKRAAAAAKGAPATNGVKKTSPKKEGATGKAHKSIFGLLKTKLAASQKDEALKDLEKSLKVLESRTNLSKTGKRKMRSLMKLKRKLEQGVDVKTAVNAPAAVSPTTKKAKRQRKAKVEVKTPKAPVKNVAADDDDDDDDDDDESEDDSDVDDDNDDSSEEEESDEQEEVNVKPPAKKAFVKKEAAAAGGNQKQSRYVLFIGNIPFDSTKEDVSEHFAACGSIADVRFIKDKKTNSPKGCAYLELKNEQGYQKALSMNQSTFKGRKINVNPEKARPAFKNKN